MVDFMCFAKMNLKHIWTFKSNAVHMQCVGLLTRLQRTKCGQWGRGEKRTRISAMKDNTL